MPLGWSRLDIRPMEVSDLRMLARWLNEPHVLEWWRTPLEPPAIEAKYLPRLAGREPTHMWLASVGAREIGWMQWYRWADYAEHASKIGAEPGSAGLDLAIGEADMLGRGVGPAMIRALVEGVVFSQPDVVACVCDPDTRNIRSLRAFEKAGFERLRSVGSVEVVWRGRVSSAG